MRSACSTRDRDGDQDGAAEDHALGGPDHDLLVAPIDRFHRAVEIDLDIGAVARDERAVAVFDRPVFLREAEARGVVGRDLFRRRGHVAGIGAAKELPQGSAGAIEIGGGHILAGFAQQRRRGRRSRRDPTRIRPPADR